ncbi:tape measure protein [Bacteroides fragilis]|jgi:tape measure domain-containing protein|uniref:tape measure protein n=1 Tax=Bacteroides fragilis TaxID=817 RepID=UPI001D075BAD|nr:tape measure protein [Bacteroides fragilis]MCB6720534.1 tape measure protein [Bacteroides fragilis]MCE9051890.1 tape measure protein [Bacteroides fragilis]MCQ5174407.1 tape measure protein [Bacteroides fragilis]
MAKLYFRIGADFDKVIKLREEIAKLKNELKTMDSTQSPAAFKALNTQLSTSTQKMNELVANAAKAGVEMEMGFKKKIFDASQSVNGFMEKIIAQKNAVGSLQSTIRKNKELYKTIVSRGSEDKELLNHIREQERTLGKERDSLFRLTQQQAEARLSVKKLRDEYALYKDDAKDVAETNKGIAISWKKALAVIGGAGVLKALGSEIIRVRGEFQAADTAIQTLLGSKEKADVLMKQVREYAKISPLEFSDVTKATQMMLGFNIEAEKVPRYLQAIGDVSMGDTQRFSSLTLAFSQMSAAGKLMGQDLNQMINAGFNPLQQISEKTGKSIATLKEEMSKGAISAEMVQQAFIDATSAGGKFYNMSENASKTINGQLSMMQDAMDAAFNELGQKSEGVIMDGIQMTTSLIENYETVGKVLVGLVTTYGAYRTAVMLAIMATSKHTIAEVALTNARVLARKAQLALNAAMLTNPYVLLATAVIGLGAAMWAFHDSTTAAEKAQKRFDEQKKQSIKKEQEHKQRLEELISTLQNEYTSSMDRVKAMDAIKNEYPALFQKYIDEKGHIRDLIALWKEYNEEAGKRNVEENKINYNNSKKLIDEYEQVIGLWKRFGEDPNFHKNSLNESEKQLADKYKNETLSTLKSKLDEERNVLRNYQKEVRSDELAQWQLDLKKNTDVQLKVELDEMKRLQQARKNNKWYSLNVGVGSLKGATTESELQNRIDILESELKSRKTSTYQEDYEAAKKAWEDAKKKLSEIEKDKSKFTSKQYEEAKERKETAEKKYKDLGGITGSSLTKQENQAKKETEKLRKQQEGIRSQNDKISEIERKQAIQRKRQAEDMEMEISQSEIDAMTEGAEKKRMQRELDNRKEIQSLERQKEDMIQAVIQAEKEIFDAQEELKAKENNKYQKKTFDSSKVDTGKISSIWDTIIENTSKKQLDDKIRDQEASWNEYLIKFGNYQQKRLAIIEKYDKAIKEAETAGDAAILMKEKANALDDFDNSVKNSTTLMGQLFVDASQKSVNEIQGIIEKAELLMQYLAAIKDEQGNAQIGGKTVSKKDILGLGISDNTLQNLELSTEQVEALRNAIDRLKGELGGKSPFKLFKTQVKQATDKIAQGGKKNIVQGISEIGSAVTQFTPAISQFGQDLGTIFGNDDLGNKIAGISDALGGVGQTAMGVGQIMSGDIVGGAMSAVSGISSVVKALDGLFGADYSRYNEMKSQYEALDSVWDTLIDKKKEYIKMSYGDEAYKVGKEAETLIKQQTQRYYELLNELRQSGSSIGSSSLGKRIEKRLSKKDWDRISGAVGESVTNAESLLNLSAEQLKEVLADPKLVSVLNTVNGDFVKYIQDIVNGSEKLEDIQNQVKEQLTQVSFDSVFDNFVDTLMDMDSSAKDFANNFERYMQKAMLTTMLGDKYKAELQKWYDAFAAANDNKTGISEEDYKKLQEQWNDIVTDAVKERDKLKELLGWTSESSSQDSTKRGFEAMSQDTGEELNGRFTALQASNEEIKNQSVVQSQALNLLTAKADTILSVNTEVRNIADDTRNLIANSYLELMQISENTGAIVKPIQQMQKDIAEVKKNTAGLAP